MKDLLLDYTNCSSCLKKKVKKALFEYTVDNWDEMRNATRHFIPPSPEVKERPEEPDDYK
jgi:hypothetical protein